MSGSDEEDSGVKAGETMSGLDADEEDSDVEEEEERSWKRCLRSHTPTLPG